jgi:predicted nucleic acid-binding protein
MKAVFADSFYYIARLNEADLAHARAVAFSRTYTGQVFTTAWVIAELADAVAATNRRGSVVRLIQKLQSDPAVAVVPPSQNLFSRGLALFSSRLDKDWSLTDCISFVVMFDEGLTDALTGDRHFEQAGFRAVLA